ncbi:hypothetical protein BD410DRAFT_297734 [Rickenella mellea]|uniref:Uncharacterized protein n=1 Tax=Rickenella mellea TaxID=50990 RepID=A0A4Y7Q1S7_9AGAM|nr:hypothetical protein BD410DRAFT_297734 [Rickenella mellea]
MRQFANNLKVKAKDKIQRLGRSPSPAPDAVGSHAATRPTEADSVQPQSSTGEQVIGGISQSSSTQGTQVAPLQAQASTMNQGGTASSQSTTPQVDLVQTQASTVQQVIGGISQSPSAQVTQVVVPPLQAQADAINQGGIPTSQTTLPQAELGSPQAEAKHVMEQAGIELSKMYYPGRVPATLVPAGNKANDATDRTTKLDDVAQPLLSKLKIFTEVVDKIAEVHPYAKMAWSVLSAAHKVCDSNP